jgi:hypothetical protein
LNEQGVYEGRVEAKMIRQPDQGCDAHDPKELHIVVSNRQCSEHDKSNVAKNIPFDKLEYMAKNGVDNCHYRNKMSEFGAISVTYPKITSAVTAKKGFVTIATFYGTIRKNEH